MRVCYFGTYREEYSRNKITLAALKQAGIEVIECHETLWGSIEDRIKLASGGWLSLKFLWKAIQEYFRLVGRYFSLPDFDVLMIGYPGQIDVFLARILAWSRRKPLVWDVFMSIYLISLERGLEKKSGLTIKLLRFIEYLGLRLPDLLFQDTTQYVNWFVSTFHISAQSFRLVPTGADDRIFHPYPEISRDAGAPFKVLYYGTYIPNHGVTYIIQAARLLQDHSDIVFEMIGDGPDKEIAEKLANDYKLRNVTFLDWMPQPDLIPSAAQADVILGAFGTTPQSLMTVQNKIYEGLALGRPVITGASAAIDSQFDPGVHLLTCDRSDPQTLAQAILQLKTNPELSKALRVNGHALYLAQYSIRKQGERIRQYLTELLASKDGRTS